MQLLTTSLLTTNQVSAVLGLQPATLKKWRVLGIGPKYTRVGRRAIRYRLADLKQFIADAFSRWCKQRKEEPIMAPNAFGSRLEEKGYRAGRNGTSRWREGLRLKPSAKGWTI